MAPGLREGRPHGATLQKRTHIDSWIADRISGEDPVPGPF